MMLPAPPPRALLLPGLSLRAGDLLGGRFRLESLVSADRALVHLAAEIVSKHTKVDLFVLVGDDINDAVRLEFLAEARKTAALASEHAARVLHVGVTHDGHPFVVQERLPERTLAGLLEDGHSLDADQAVDIALDVCDALLEAHTLDVTHAELGTHSVHLAWTDGRPASVKLVGLATARVLASLPLDASTIGRPVMRAPELLADRRARGTASADVWGIGVLLYTMLAGAPPFMAETPSAVSVSVTNEEQASLAGVPDAVAELVDACLSKDPAKRPASIREVADRLLPFASKPAESLARIVARVERPKAPARTSLAPSPDLLAITAAGPAVIPPAALPTQRAIPAALDVMTPAASFVAVGADFSEIGGETGRYHASELERLQREVAKPAESELSIDVEFGASTREVAAALDSSPASDRNAPTAAAIKAAKPSSPAVDDEAARTLSPPPVAVTIPPPPSENAALVARSSEPKLAVARKHDASSDAKIAQAAADAKAAAARAEAAEAAAAARASSSSMRPVANTLAPAPKASPRWLRTSGAMTAAACLAAGIILGILVPRAQSKDAASRHDPPLAVTEISAPTLQTATIVTTPAIEPVADAPKTPEVASTSAATLPDAKPEPKAAAAKGTLPLASKAKPAAAPAPVRNVDTAPAKPETKAHDDDLRRFLDDRR